LNSANLTEFWWDRSLSTFLRRVVVPGRAAAHPDAGMQMIAKTRLFCGAILMHDGYQTHNARRRAAATL
jgi:hypothetical protein